MKAVFVDRDGVINELVYYQEHGVIDSPFTPAQLKLLPRVGEAIKKLRDGGYKVVLVSNQPGMAKGNITAENFEKIKQVMRAALAQEDVVLDGEYYCLHHPEARVEEYRRDCDCRKPKPGLLLKAAREMGIDLSLSWMIGDNLTDIAAGKAAGCRTVLVGRQKCELCHLISESGTLPEIVLPNLWEAANFILRNRRSGMEIFIDSASISEIGKWLNSGLIDGVTTNPSIMMKDGVYNIKKGAKEIASLINPLPLSVEVTTDNYEEMLTQAREFASWASNINVKIPQTTQEGLLCYNVMRQLENEGIKVNATVALSLGQVILSAKAGASYISIFAGRVADEGGDAPGLISSAAEWLSLWNYKSKIIVGSIRGVIDIQQAALAGAHVITIPPQFLSKMADHKYTRDTVKQFMADARKSLEMMEKAKVAHS